MPKEYDEESLFHGGEEDSLLIDLECFGCEALFAIVLAEDFLNTEPSYCPFCGDGLHD